MKISKLGLVLLTSTCSHAFILDKSCGDAKGNLAMRVKKSVREAKLALANAAEVAEQCEADCSLQSAVDDQILAEVKQWCGDGGDIERRKASNSLLVKFLGDESADTWSKVHSATSKAKEVLKTSSDQSDNAKIYCGDSSFVRQAGLWKDEDSEYADIAWTADKTSPQRPCEKVIGLGLYQTGATHKGILLCNYKDMLDTKTSHTVAGNYFSYSNLLDSTTDVPIAAFADKISSVLIHEMIHLGDMQQFPLIIDQKTKKTEQYGYDECEKLAGTDASWHNCDTFALITQAMYMNTYYSDENLLKKLPKDQQPPATEVNGPYGLKEKKN